MRRIEARIGGWAAAPLLVLLAIGFAAPLLIVAVYSVMPQRTFSLFQVPTLESYLVFVEQGYIKSLLWTLGLAAATTVILLVLCYPLAYAMARLFRRFTIFLTVAIVAMLVVSENIRLFGWSLTLMKGGLIDGHLAAWFGAGPGSALYNAPVIVFGLVYVYFPFMLFPLVQGVSMVPAETRHAAFDLGATRAQVLREIDLPLALPGIVVGSLLTFVLSAGALAESKLLGGQTVVVMADEIETAFTYGQNWPLGSSLAMVLIAMIGVMAYLALGRLDLDEIMGRRDG